MRTLLYILILMLFYSCSEKKIKNDLTDMRLDGNIKSIIYYTYYTNDYNENIYSRKFNYKQIINFNDAGNITEKIGYDSNGKISDREIRKYDANNYQIEYSTYDADSKLKLKLIYVNDKNGNHKTILQYRSDGKLISKSTYDFDSSGNQIESRQYNPQGILEYTTEYKYDKYGNQTEMRTFDTTGVPSLIQINKYDKDILKEQISQLPDGTISYKILYNHDEDGRIIERQMINFDGSIRDHYNFEFKDHDKYGNWLKKIEYNRGKVEAIILREIKYF